MRLDDPRLAELAGATRGLSAIVSFVEELADHRLFIAAALLEDGELRARPSQAVPADLRPVRRAPLLRRRATCCGPSRRGSGSGSGSRVCEDFWHLPVPQILALDGAQILVNISSSPGARPGRHERGRARDRDVVADADADVRPADDLVRRLLQPGRGRRIDLVLGRLRGHRADRPGRLQRAALRRGAVHGRDRRWPTSGASGSRCRCCATNGSSSRSASCAGWSPSVPGWRTTSTAERGAEAGFDLVAAEPPSEPIGFGVAGERATAPRWTAAHDGDRAGAGPGAPFELPEELAIDTDVARRVIAEFIRGQLEQAGFERAVLGLSGGIDSALVGLPRCRGDRSRAAAGGDAAVPDVVAGVAGGRGVGRRGARLSPATSWTSRPWSTATSGRDDARCRGTRQRESPGRCDAATSRRGCGWPSCTTAR